MRKKTAPRSRKPNQASASGKKGLIANDHNRRHSAGTQSAIDNHSHRTFNGLRRPGAHRQVSAGLSDALHCDYFHGLRRSAAEGRAT